MDYNALAKQYGGTTVSSTAPKKVDYNALAKQNGAISTSAPAPTQPSDGGFSVGGFVKGLVSAPATLIARPFQAIQSGIQLAGMDIAGNTAKMKDLNDRAYALARSLRTAREEDKPAIRAQVQSLSAQAQEIGNKLSQGADWKPSSGGIIAAAPENMGDVKKDVGRAVQTVALGVGAPIAGGALFGLGSSLEQGNDLMSTETLVSTLTGMAAGKLLDVVGKPIIDVAGKVVGNVTPKFLKELALKGQGAVSNFMDSHEILGGALKPVTEKITAGANAFDNTINKGTSSLWSNTKAGIKSQYPSTSSDISSHYENIEVDRFMKPTTEAGATFNKAADVAKDAERRGIDIKKVMKDNKIYASDHISDGKFDTKDIADALKSEAISGGADVFRPALAEAQNSVERVPISEIRQKMIDGVKSARPADISPNQKLSFIKKINSEYGDNSVTAALYKDGYNLTNLYDSKLQTSSGIYKTPKNGGVSSISDTLTGKQKAIESKVFGDLLVERSPKELGIGDYMKAQEEKFITSNYLATLDGKKAPTTLFQRGIRRASQLSGATLGAKVAGPFGMFSGYSFGGLVSDTFAKAPNPVKIAFLKDIGKTEPEIYAVMKEFVSDSEAKRMAMVTPRLKSGSKIDIGLQNLKNKIGAIEMGSPTSKSNTFANNINQNARILSNTPQLTAPSDRIITPNTQGTPNFRATGSSGDVGGMRQRIFKK